MQIFRIHIAGNDTTVAAVVAESHDLAQAFAQGRYGASADAEVVKPVGAGKVTEIFNTHEVAAHTLTGGSKLRKVRLVSKL